jgi:TM2 domain-containing membrane protein YozV
MGWSFRRSLKFGPFRLNLSKSGIGYSLGIPGFRMGKSARGSLYRSASIPGTGIYNRTYFSNSQVKQPGQTSPSNITLPQTRLAAPPFSVESEQMLAGLTDEQKQSFHARYVLKQKDRNKMLWISVLLGLFGVDRFMLGNVFYGVVKLLVSLVSIRINYFSVPLLLWLIDLFLIRKSTDQYNLILADKLLQGMAAESTGTPQPPPPILASSPIVAPNEARALPEDNTAKPKRKRRTPEEMRVAHLEFVGKRRLENLQHSLIEQKKQTGVSITHYTWQSAGDERTCQACLANDGKRFAWNSPPLRTGHPGQCTTCDEGYCRCAALPYIPEAEDH